MSQPTPDDILKAVREAGWLLEQDTARSLDSLGFHTALGWAYEDPDEPSNSREIDVMGYRRFLSNEEHRFTVSARVLAECKQSNPYVLIGREQQAPLRKGLPRQHTLRFQNLITGTDRKESGLTKNQYRSAWIALGLHTMPGSPSLESFRASQLVRLDRGKTWTADNSGIFNSLVFPLAKAVQAAQKDYATEKWPTSPLRVEERTHVALHFPIVVTSAPLYRVDATHPESSIMEIQWGKVVRQLETRSLKGLFEIDVVNYQHLPNYLSDQVVQYAANVASLANEDPLLFLEPTSPTFNGPFGQGRP